MRVAEQYRELESRLPAGWADARFVLKTDDPAQADRAASLLSAYAPGRVGNEVRFTVSRQGGRLDQARRMLERIDREGISGTLELVTASETAPEAGETRTAWPPGADQWDTAMTGVPEDWSDLYGQVELASSDYLDRAALLLAPVNPARYGGAVGFRFRVGRSGYGAAPAMARRCLERLDGERIGARVTILHYMADTKPVLTQGPVWYMDGGPV